MIESIEEIQETFVEQNYIADRALATTIYLAHHLNKPIFLEGEPGVGKNRSRKGFGKCNRWKSHPFAMLRRIGCQQCVV